jgi:hypothetical protein
MIPAVIWKKQIVACLRSVVGTEGVPCLKGVYHTCLHYRRQPDLISSHVVSLSIRIIRFCKMTLNVWSLVVSIIYKSQKIVCKDLFFTAWIFSIFLASISRLSRKLLLIQRSIIPSISYEVPQHHPWPCRRSFGNRRPHPLWRPL